MSNENEEVEDEDLLDDEDFDELEDDDESDDEDEKDDKDGSDKGKKSKDTTDWKAKYKKLKGIAKRQRTKLSKQKEKPPEKKDDKKVEEKDKKDDKKGLDRIDKYFLRGEGIKTSDEIKLVEEIVAETGKTVEEIVDLKYFQTRLKELRDNEAAKDAAPKGTKRQGSGSRNDVDYWLAKDELPPVDQPELRRKVVNAKIARKKSTSEFSDTPVVS